MYTCVYAYICIYTYTLASTPALLCRCPMPTYGCYVSLDFDVAIPS